MSEELQRYLVSTEGKKSYHGDHLGKYEHYILGSTTLNQIKSAGIIRGFTTDIEYTPRIWDGKSSPQSRPDEIVLDGRSVIAVVERKTSDELRTPIQEETASEQCLVYLQQLGGKLGIITDYTKFIWIHDFGDRPNELRYIYDGDLLFSKDYRIEGTIEEVLQRLDPKTDSIIHEEAVDPSSLADKVWQTIWLTTHEDPKHCLATFVELFLYKFLSDLELLPEALRIERLNCDEETFRRGQGKTQIEFYVQTVRPRMKSLFPPKDPPTYPIDDFLPGSDTTSIIDGFVFLEPGIANHNHPLETFNHSFLQIIKDFVEFGKMRKIDNEFKSRVYEKFLKKNVKQQKLGQYLTPRNVVRAIIRMSNPRRLKSEVGKSICDPASGVGGFLLEPIIHEDLLKNNYEVIDGKLRWKVELVGLELDRQTNIMAKANMLIHMAEDYVSFSTEIRRSFATLMNQTFILTDHDKLLGALEFPQRNRFDLILTNPPFVVSGTKVIKDKINQIHRLRQRYSHAGIGTESLFIRWIVDSLKPGGRAFVIVPTGILTRSETVVRCYIRANCILDGIVSLPKRTFFHNTNPTYVLTFTKKTENSEQTPNVFAYVVREIGESRDALRLSCYSDLPDLIRQFRAFYADKEVFEPRNLNCKLIPCEKLKPEDRWDINRFWSEEEKRELGIIESRKTIPLSEFESLVESTLSSVKADIEQLKETNNDINMDFKHSIFIKLENEDYFTFIKGKRVRKTDIHNNPGDVPVISTSQEIDGYLGFASEDWLIENKSPILKGGLITVNMDGSIGTVFLRNEPKYTINDVVIAVKILNEILDPMYLVYAIKEAIAREQFRYDAKLYKKRLKKLRIRVPINEEGNLDLEQQRTLARKYEYLEELKKTVMSFATELKGKFIAID